MRGEDTALPERCELRPLNIKRFRLDQIIVRQSVDSRLFGIQFPLTPAQPGVRGDDVPVLHGNDSVFDYTRAGAAFEINHMHGNLGPFHTCHSALFSRTAE
jgi:hypothetical protein